ELAGWNQTENDWRRLLSLQPDGCFCATIGSEVVATTTTTAYGNELAWIGMVLVDPVHRKRGIATRLMEVAIDYLSKVGVTTIKLDATVAGHPLYESLGFKDESLIERWEGIAGTAAGDATLDLDRAMRQEVLTLDRQSFGADRSKLVEMLIADAHVRPLVTRGMDGRVTGYALARRGTAAAYVGPLMATVPAAASELLDGLVNQLSGESVYVDLNTESVGGREMLEARGLSKQRDLIRMSYGKGSLAGTSPPILAIAGPEVG
ncbi:MAG: GNAT family N-acetyltransferase, partial [Acidobacteriota bacterium]|nr:GNAT family N-acetyltransferase [Acidobacteriota bacterium]